MTKISTLWWLLSPLQRWTLVFLLPTGVLAWQVSGFAVGEWLLAALIWLSSVLVDAWGRKSEGTHHVE